MGTILNINSYYRNLVQSNAVKNTVRVISEVAFRTLHVIQIVSVISISCVSLPFMLIYRMLEKGEARISSQNSSNSLQKIINRIEFITCFIFKMLSAGILSLLKFLTDFVYAVNFYIEDISKRISQKTLEMVGIPVQLPISERQLMSIVTQWESHASTDENRSEATEKIKTFFAESKLAFLAPKLLGNDLHLRKHNLQGLPDIFHYKPFSNIKHLDLSDNQLRVLPEGISALHKLNILNLTHNNSSNIPDILHKLPTNCEIIVSPDELPGKELIRILEIINQPNYKGAQLCQRIE